MKNAIPALLLAAVLAVSLTGCGGEPLFTKLDDSSTSALADSSSPEPISRAESQATSEPSSEPESADPYLGAAVPESKARDKSYLDDAVFVGDSLTFGLGAYEVLDASRVIAHTGINPQTILTKPCIEQPDGSTLTALDAVKAAAPRKIYLMLGSNGIAFLTQADILSCYGDFLTQLHTALPDSILYVQSVLPVTHEKETEDDRYANSKIDALNAELLKLATEKGAYYVSVADAIKDENGCLPTAKSGDGMHFGVSTYEKWVDYVLSHTVDETRLPQ